MGELISAACVFRLGEYFAVEEVVAKERLELIPEIDQE